MLDQAAQIGMMMPDARWNFTESLHQFLIHEERLCQGTQMRITHLAQKGANLFNQLTDVLFGVWQKL